MPGRPPSESVQGQKWHWPQQRRRRKKGKFVVPNEVRHVLNKVHLRHLNKEFKLQLN